MLAIKFIVEMVQGENGGLLFGNVNKRIKLLYDDEYGVK